MKKLLVIDNYDSFTYNLVQMFRTFDLKIMVYRNDINTGIVQKILPDYILISPGPKSPANAGISKFIIEKYCKKIPILGVCLGMQCINEVFGGNTIKADKPVHGKTSDIYHNNTGIFKNLPNPFKAARYHSLLVESKNSENELIILAKTADNIIMGIKHKTFPVSGVQFHPESFLTESGFALIKNFIDKNI